MRNSIRTLLLLTGLFLGAAAPAQDIEADAAPETIDLAELDAGLWAYFEGAPDEVGPRIDTFLADAEMAVAGLQPSNEEAAQAILDAVNDNLAAYMALRADESVELQALPPPKTEYSLDDLLRQAAVAREARAGADEARLEVEREQRILEGAGRRRDLAFKEYFLAAAGDEKILAGLRLIQTRSAQAIATRRLDLLVQSLRRARDWADAADERVIFARDTLAPPDDQSQLDALDAQVEVAGKSLDEARERRRKAGLEATGLDLGAPEERSRQRLLNQKLIDASVDVALSEIELAKSKARRWWAVLHLEAAPDLDEMSEDTFARSELVRAVRQELSVWLGDSEDEMLAVQTAGRDGLSRSARRLLDQRAGTAQGTLARIAQAEEAVADLELLGTVVESATARYSGTVSAWLRGVGQDVKSAYRRVAAFADVTLFSVGETPVTGRDLLRVLLIMIVAWLLSRGIRFAIRRFSERESTGTQASLYTVSRLTHYAIIIIAMFVALSSIGLDFSSLALIAGALGVGIGFGLQSIVSNFVSGLIILFEHTLRVGDYIELDTGLTGTVKAINVRSTLINTNDNIDIVVPNSEFVTTRLTNWTLNERILRVRIPFGVAYGSDKELVRQAACEAANEVKYTLKHMKNREPDVWLVDFGDNSLNFLMMVWVNRDGARRPMRTRAAYLWALESKLTEYGIEIPFPQRDLHLRSGWPPPESRPDTGADDED